jgi:hypothetical protein
LAATTLEDSWLKQYLAAAAAMVKSIGGHRSRGLGRCRITLGEAPAGDKIVLPPVLPNSASGLN